MPKYVLIGLAVVIGAFIIMSYWPKQKEITKKVSVLKSYNSAADASKALLSEILEIDCGRSILPNRRLTDSETKELISRAKEVGLI